MRRLAPVALLGLLLLPSGLPAMDAPEAMRIRAALREALAQVGLTPADLVVRDVRMWERNAPRLRAEGRIAEGFPLPAERELVALRPPLVSRAVRSPLAALDLALRLGRGREPPGLRPVRLLAAEPPARLAERMVGMAHVPERPDERLPRWMIGEIPAEETAAARALFSSLRKPCSRGYPFLPPRVPLAAAPAGGWPTGKPRRLPGAGGAIVIGTEGDDVYEEDAWILIDPGGNDLYRNNAGGAVGGAAILIDLGGNDRYESDRPFVQGAAHGGVGILVDVAGDDVYVGGDFCQGVAVGGTGVLLDLAGNDTYTAGRFAQGAGAFGTGTLEDRGGDDRYSIGQLGQGLGRTAGYGILRDVAGNDRYVARPEYESMYSQWTGGRKVHWSFAQGCGFGFYCRYEEELEGGGKGLVIRELLPGGVGLLADDAGDDVYEGSMYAQGTAYFYGLGILCDRAGDDSYTATWYGQGAAPHFAAGILVDAAGNDRYRGMNQVQGNGRDFSTAVFVDLAGDDSYFGEDRVQGCGDLNDSAGIFVDLAGDDRYEARKRTARGFATNTDPGRQPRPGRPYRDVGVFLDLGGKDEYLGPAKGGDGRTWFQRATLRGVGLDR